jgi:peptide/nickel transport system permease protein
MIGRGRKIYSLLWKKRKARAAISFLILLVVVGVLADLFVSGNGGGFISFTPNEISQYTQSYQAPGFVQVDGRVHLLGTDGIGRDVASRLLFGIRTSLAIGVLSSLVSFLIALLLGIISGYFGDQAIKIHWLHLLVVIGILPILWIWSQEWALRTDTVNAGSIHRGWGILYFSLAVVPVNVLLSRLNKLRGRKISLPVDTIIVKLIEIFRSIPGLFLLLTLFSLVSRPSLLNVIIIIGLLRWPHMTRLLRAEIMKVRAEHFITAAKTLGLPDWRIIMNHVIPNSIGPVIVTMAFTMSSAILIESTLSFLSIGLPPDLPSWGAILNDSRTYFSAWWLAVFPGILIFSTVLAFNFIGDSLNEINRPSA